MGGRSTQTRIRPESTEEGQVPWSGNIVIEGSAGSGKSTLALQLALAFTHWPTGTVRSNLALEEGVDNLRAKAREISPDWHTRLWPVAFHDDAGTDSSPGEIGRQLANLLTQPRLCPTRVGGGPGPGRACSRFARHEQGTSPKVLLPGLSPRGFAPAATAEHTLFWERLQQLERLLMALNG